MGPFRPRRGRSRPRPVRAQVLLRVSAVSCKLPVFRNGKLELNRFMLCLSLLNRKGTRGKGVRCRAWIRKGIVLAAAAGFASVCAPRAGHAEETESQRFRSFLDRAYQGVVHRSPILAAEFGE